MVLTDLKHWAVWKVSILRWSVFWGHGNIDLLFPDVLWEFQKPEGSQRGGSEDKFTDWFREKTESEGQ